MSSKSIHIKPTPYYRKREHSPAYKVFMGSSDLSMGDGWTAIGVLIKA